MGRINWDLMRPQDIEIRPAQVKDGKVTLLLYQNSRTAMDALDRSFGEFGWQMEYRAVGEQIYGCLSIKDPDTGEWISKMDTGEESNISAQKGQSSDILKRCAVRFGYGRELYTAPRIVVDDDGYNCSGYKVSKIAYNNNREIVELHIVNRFGKPVFDWGGEKVSAPAPKESGNKVEELRAFCSMMKEQEGINRNELKRFFEWYLGKAEKWNGPFNAQSLWDKWMEKAVA